MSILDECAIDEIQGKAGMVLIGQPIKYKGRDCVVVDIDQAGNIKEVGFMPDNRLYMIGDIISNSKYTCPPDVLKAKKEGWRIPTSYWFAATFGKSDYETACNPKAQLFLQALKTIYGSGVNEFICGNLGHTKHDMSEYYMRYSICDPSGYWSKEDYLDYLKGCGKSSVRGSSSRVLSYLLMVCKYNPEN